MQQPYGNLPSKPITPVGASSRTTSNITGTGGNTYYQGTVGRNFTVITPIAGHTQKLNLKK